MKKTIIYLLLIPFIISCASNTKTTKSETKTAKYPHWFIYPANTITGYAPVYFTAESSAKEATKQAAENYMKFNHCVVMGIQTYIQSPNGLDLVYDSLFIHVEEVPDDEKFLKKKFTHADTSATDNMVMVAHSNKSIDGSEQKPFTDKVEWIETPPEDRESYYAIGSCSRIFSEHKAWEEAENNAIMNLARKITLANAVEILIDEDKLMSKFNEEVNIVLKNIQIIERWKDPQTNSYYVLIRM